MSQSHFKELNEHQYAAVSAEQIPILVLAGPGTGKTRLLVFRIIWLIEKENISPGHILALTFTNKAAQEMQNRLHSYMGLAAEAVSTSTFHAFALSILRKNYNEAGLDKFFSVCDQEYQFNLVRSLAEPYIRENLDNKVRGILLSFSNHLVKDRKIPEFTHDIFSKYQKHLSDHNLVDFDQIMIRCKTLLQNNPDILKEYQYLFPAVLVDEFQDTDPVQYDILKMLTWESKNVFVVADDDQSIYSWRGANPDNIKKYIADYEIKNPVFLKLNYRSGNTILKAAHQIIKKTQRIEPDKQLAVIEDIKDSLDLKFFMDELKEAAFIISQIETWRTQKVDYRDMAIIYPYHKIGRQLEKHLINAQIPFQLADGKSVFDHPAIKKILLYLKLIRDSEDPVALEDLTRHELGPAIAGLIKQTTISERISYRQALYTFYRDRAGKLGHDMRLKIQTFVNYLANVINLKEFYNLEQLLDEILTTADTNQFSNLTTHANQLQPLTELNHLLPAETMITATTKLAVYCADAEIHFLACQLVHDVLNIIPVGAHTDAEIVIALDEFKKEGHTIIPVYKLLTPERTAKLSCLFKWLQWYTTKKGLQPLENYVILDLETTDKNVDSCGVVEIAAIKIEQGELSNKFSRLINPQKPISAGAQAVHNIIDKDVQNQPTIENIWPEFLSFIGEDILIAHNGHQFDFPILDRFSRQISGNKIKNAKLDSLVMARMIFPGQANSIDALMNRFNLAAETRHRALDDVIVLNDILLNLQKIKSETARKVVLESVLDIVALGNYLEKKTSATEDHIFFKSGSRKLISPYSKIRSAYAHKFDADRSKILEQLKSKVTQVAPLQNEEEVWQRIRELAHQFNALPIDEAVIQFLSLMALYSPQDHLQNVNALSMLTFHAAKGLEFDKVILMGMENDNMPSFTAMRKDLDDDRPVSQKMEEQRRLFYVGLTRARTELILTAVKNRGGWQRESSPFLKEINNL